MRVEVTPPPPASQRPESRRSRPAGGTLLTRWVDGLSLADRRPPGMAGAEPTGTYLWRVGQTQPVHPPLAKRRSRASPLLHRGAGMHPYVDHAQRRLHRRHHL